MKSDQDISESSLPSENDGTVVIVPNKRTVWLWMIFFSSASLFSLLFALEELFLGLTCFLFFGILALATGTQLLPGLTFIKLTPLGFETRNIRQRIFVEWNIVEAFFVERVGKGKYVAFRLKNFARAKRSVAAMALVPKNVDGIIPFSYGLDLPKLAIQMNEWRKRYSNPNGQDVTAQD